MKFLYKKFPKKFLKKFGVIGVPRVPRNRGSGGTPNPEFGVQSDPEITTWKIS